MISPTAKDLERAAYLFTTQFHALKDDSEDWAVVDAIALVLAEERERCAQIADAHTVLPEDDGRCNGAAHGYAIAMAIRRSASAPLPPPPATA